MSLLFTYNVENHEKHKHKLIELINLLPRNRHDAVSHTDWNLPVNMQKEWQGYFFKHINMLNNNIKYIRNLDEEELNKNLEWVFENCSNEKLELWSYKKMLKI